MTLSWTCPISLQPPLLALAIHQSRYTHDLLVRSDECVLNIPGRPLGDYVMQFGSRSGADFDKLADSQLALESGRRVSAAWISRCLAHIECSVIDRFSPGDHSLFVAQVVGAWAESEAFDVSWQIQGQQEDLAPMTHLGGNLFGLLGSSVTLK